MDDGGESRRGEGRLCTHGLRPWRATCGSLVQTLALEPTYVPVAPHRLDLLYIPLDSSVTVTPTSCKLSHLGTCNTAVRATSASPLRFVVASFLFNRISFDPPPFYPFPRSSPIVRRAFFAYPFDAYVTEQIGDGESYVGPYLRLSRPMYRDRGETCGCSRSLLNRSEPGGSLFAKLILEQRRAAALDRSIFGTLRAGYVEGLVRCGRSNAVLEIH